MSKARTIFEGIAYGNASVLVHNGFARSRNLPRTLHKHPVPTRGHSPRRINRLLAGLPHAHRYLEIGLGSGSTLENVQADIRWGVDPRPRCDLHRLPPGVQLTVSTSDDFFRTMRPHTCVFDVIYLDGLHTFRQTYRDLLNSFQLSPNAMVLMDDVIPVDEVSAIPDYRLAVEAHGRLGLSRDATIWHGDVFRVLLCLRSSHPELAFRTIEGPGNAQTLVWKKDESARLATVEESVLRSLESVQYSDVFGNGIPSYLRPMSEALALEEALNEFAGSRGPSHGEDSAGRKV